MKLIYCWLSALTIWEILTRLIARANYKRQMKINEIYTKTVAENLAAIKETLNREK